MKPKTPQSPPREPGVEISHYIGHDIGKQSDPASLCVLERRDRPGSPLPAYLVRYLAQFHLGTSYARVKADVARMAADKRLRHPLLVADNTGVGSPVVDDLREADVPLLAVTITGGEAAASRAPDGTWRVPKKDLVGALQVVLYDRRLTVPAGMPGADVLARQLRDLQVKVTKAANERFEHAAGAKDDLALALALALWAAERSCGALPTQDASDDNRTLVSQAPDGVFWS